jgi:hypothetical protein
MPGTLLGRPPHPSSVTSKSISRLVVTDLTASQLPVKPIDRFHREQATDDELAASVMLTRACWRRASKRMRGRKLKPLSRGVQTREVILVEDTGEK